jgi:hypothetical protein
MKKAAQYASAYNADPTLDTVRRIAFEFLMETKEMTVNRGVKTDSALLAVFQEQDRKWRKLARLAGGGQALREDGFRLLVVAEFPPLATSLGWQTSQHQEGVSQ